MKTIYTFLAALCFPAFLFAQGATDDWTFYEQAGDGWFGSLAEDANGNIIVGGGSPNSHFRVFNGTSWTNYLPSDFGISSSFFGRDVTVDLDNNVWLSPGNNNGVSRWDGSTIENYITSNSDIISNSNFGVAVDQNNKLWTGSLQSFDGTNWETFGNNGCYEGSPRTVFVDSNNDVWVSGIVSVGIETGIITQPCVYRISNGTLTTFHIDNGDNLPNLDAVYGSHLINQLSDGTVFITGLGSGGIEIKTFNGTSWDDLDASNSPEVGESYWGLCIDENDNIFLGGERNSQTAQIVKYCAGEWTFYDLPEADGFPPIIYDLMIDSQSRLWIAGNIGLASVPYVPTSCATTAIHSPESTRFCGSLNYSQGFLSFQDCYVDDFNTVDFLIYDATGKLIKKDAFSGSNQFVGKLSTGIYFAQLRDKSGATQALKFFAG